MPEVVKLVGTTATIRCPGCGEFHSMQVAPSGGPVSGPNWGFNGNLEKPTFTPSILSRSGHYASHFVPGSSCWCTYNAEHPEDATFNCNICHSFVTDGRIQFLNDCTHALAGQTVDLPPYMKIKDISSEWGQARRDCQHEPGDSPNDHIDWKCIRSEGYEAVSIDGKVYEYSKHGLLDEVKKTNS